MIEMIRKTVVHGWNFIFNDKVSPLRHISDVAMRHYVLQALGLMWAVSFAAAIGSYAFGIASVVGHTILIAAAAITVSTWTVASKKPELFERDSARKDRREKD